MAPARVLVVGAGAANPKSAVALNLAAALAAAGTPARPCDLVDDVLLPAPARPELTEGRTAKILDRMNKIHRMHRMTARATTIN